MQPFSHTLQCITRTIQNIRRHLDRFRREGPVLLLHSVPDEGIHGAFERVFRIRCEDDVFELCAAG